MLEEIMIQLGNTYSDEDYVTVVEDVYEDIYDEVAENEEYATYFEEDCSFEIKELIAQYLNHENFRDMTRDANEKINKKIENALEALEKYDTPEFRCLRDNGFYDSSIERAPHLGNANEEWHLAYKQGFIEKAQKLGVEELQAEKITLGLLSLI